MTTNTPNAQSYRRRIEALRETKSAHTEEKTRLGGYHDVDDHGCIPWTGPIPFTVEPNHPDGRAYGLAACGRNFRRWLEAHPVYIHPRSALAGAWIGGPPGVGGWPAEARPTHLDEVHRKYRYVWTGIGGVNHCGPDMRIGLELGWGGLLAKLRHFRDLNRPVDASFYDGEEAVVVGVQDWIRRHADEARRMAADQPDPEVRANLLEIAEMNERLVENPPRTLREACQFMAWFQSIDRMWGCGGALGQLDELLRPYYEADRSAGRLEDDEAVWCIASLLFNDTHYSQIGGPSPIDGHDVTSAVSFLILEATHVLRIPSNIGVRLHDGLNPELLRRAVQYLFEDGTGCCFACSKALDEGYARNGVPMQVARMRAKVGCNWTALPGIEYCLQDVTRLPLATPLSHALRDVVADGPRTMERLWDRYAYHLGIVVDALKRGKDWHMEHQSRYMPEIVLNLFMHGPIERGLDMAAGGVDIYNLTVDGVGLATVADSLAAVEQRVVNEGRLTWDELGRLLETDYAGAERERLMLKSIPRYGSGGTRADWWARRVSDLFADLVRGTPTPDGFTVLPGLFSHGIVRELGRDVGATPNGRRAGEPISHSADPDPGFLPDGGSAPTAKSNAVAEVQPHWGNTTPLQIDLDSGLAREIGGIEAVEALLKGHADLGGSVININVISKQQILEAHKDPSKYPDLVIRVTGYSAYFKTLSPEYRQQVVDRVLAEG